MSIDTKPLEDLEKKLARFDDEFAKEFVDRVKSRTPVITGYLKGSWASDVGKTEILIYNTAEYASYVEYGTERLAPRGMLATTITEKEQIAAVAKQKAGL